MIQFKPVAAVQGTFSGSSCHLSWPEALFNLPPPLLECYSCLYGKQTAKEVKDGNYLIGLLTNNSVSVAARQFSWGGFKGCVLD